MRPNNLYRHCLPLLVACVAGSSLMAADLTVFPSAGLAAGRYSEQGNWANAPEQNAQLAPEVGVARLASAADGVLNAQATFSFELSTSGQYRLELAYPPAANASNVTVRVGPESVYFYTPAPTSIDGQNLISWQDIGVLIASNPVTVTVTIDGTTSTGAVNADAPWALGVSGARLIAMPLVANETAITRLAGGEAADPFAMTDPPAQLADPFSAPGAGTPATGGVNPFATETVAQPLTPDPFTINTQADAAADPFTAPPAAAVPAGAAIADPFAAPALEQSGQFSSPAIATGAIPDPFALPSQPTAVDPFSNSPAQPINPFMEESDTAGIAQPANPFAPTEAPTNISVPPTQVVVASDPFADSAPQVQATPAVPVRSSIPLALTTETLDLVELNFGTNLEAAVAEGRRQRKPVLVLFSGDSTQAVGFEQMLSRREVADVLRDYILVRVDYRQNRPLARKYAVMSYPYIVVINRHGFTEGHIAPMRNATGLRDTLRSFTQQIF